jgi:hypothetical protein
MRTLRGWTLVSTVAVRRGSVILSSENTAIHIRAQFNHFENLNAIDDASYKKEVSDWLNGTECKEVFERTESFLFDWLLQSRKELNITDDEPSYVYLGTFSAVGQDSCLVLFHGIHR